jgi:hypothetical protein
MLLASMAAASYALTSSLLPILPVELGADATLDLIASDPMASDPMASDLMASDLMASDLMASTSEIEGERWPPCLCWRGDCTAGWLEA